MISISSYSPNKYYQLKPIEYSQSKGRVSFQAADVTDILSQGDKALNENRLQDALKFYNEAQSKDPNNSVINRKLAKTYQNLKDYVSAQKYYETYIEANSEDVDNIINLGEVQRLQGKYKLALSTFEKAASIAPNNDLAKRSILETKNNLLAAYDPDKAYRERQEYAAKNLTEALNMTVAYMSPEYMQGLSDVVIKFGKTAQMGGASNIAQYENYIKTITVSDAYTYASPQVIAAYLSHESVHAHDKDPYTSIREEQDAYEVATKFWLQHSQGIEDPEMDYAAELYQQSPTALKDRVEEIYLLRDPSIAKTSPNHPPQKKFNLINPFKKHVASAPIKTYDVIA